MKHRQRGFGPTQIETLGVVVLIGIIAALFIPNYINMMVSQRIIEAVEASQPLRDHIGRSIANGEMPLATQDIEQRFTERLVDGKLIEKLAGRRGRYGQMQFGRNIPQAHGSTLVFTATIEAGGSVKWDCTGGSLAERYRPEGCGAGTE